MSFRSLSGLVALAAMTAPCAFGQLPTSTLRAEVGHDWDDFGHSIALEDGRLLVGAPNHTEVGDGTGAAHLYERGAHGWKLTATLTAPDGTPGNVFGYSVAFSSGRALVGAYGAGPVSGHGLEWGNAYVFEEVAGAWTHTATLGAPNPGAFDWYGIDVALSGDTALICAAGDDGARGAAYLVEDRGGVWTTSARLADESGAAWDLFGSDGDIEGDVAVVGAPGHGGNTGSAYVYERHGGQWALATRLDGPASEPGTFGYRVALWDGWLFVAAQQDSSAALYGGRVYVYRQSVSGWELRQALFGADSASEHVFGKTLDAGHGKLLVGSFGGDLTGAAYLFTLQDGEWREVEKFTCPNNVQGTYFGRGLYAAEDAALVGAFGGVDTGDHAGALHLYEQLTPWTAERYCDGAPNSVGRGARLAKRGSTRLSRNELHLDLTNIPVGATALFVMSSDNQMVPFGAGWLCVSSGSSGLQRLAPPSAADSVGSASHWLDFESAPLNSGASTVWAGSTWYFQALYRDAGAGLNASDALRIRFTP